MPFSGWLRAGRRAALQALGWHGGATLWSVGVVFLLGTMMVIIAPDVPQEPKLFPRQQPLVIIDAGHGGKDDGAKARGLVEKGLTLDLAFRLEGILKKRGFQTLLTRVDDRFLPLRLRASIANAIPDPAIFVSLHFNRGRGRNTNGVETFYASRKRPSKEMGAEERWKLAGIFSFSRQADHGEHLAADVQLGICAQTGARNRGIRGRSLHVTRETEVPAILIEGGFMSDPMEARLLMNPEYLNRLATGIADGIESWSRQEPRREMPPPLVDAGVATRDYSFVALPDWLYPFVSCRGGPRPALAQCRPPLRVAAENAVISEK